VKVYVDSPHRLIRECLASVVARRHVITEECDAEVAIKDLCSYTFPYPPPAAVPTLALICGNDQGATAREVLRIGYNGYFRVEDGVQKLELALYTLLKGENWAERHVIAALLDRHSVPALTRRESQIYELAINGFSNANIAHQLGLSINTVKVYISRLLHKLEAKNRGELILKARVQR